MKTFKEFASTIIITEDITRPQADRIIRSTPKSVPIKHSLFNEADTIYHPLDTSGHVDVPSNIRDHLYEHGYRIPSSEDYRAGYAVDRHNRMVSIGKALKKSKASSDIISSFENDTNRASSNSSDLMIAYTRNPLHVATGSTDRGWTSCMNLHDGSENEFAFSDIKHGTHQAYLIKSNDRDIQNPIARISLKPFVSETGSKHVILRPESRVYGTPSIGFEEAVNTFCDTHFPSRKDTLYHKHSGVYDDDGMRMHGDVSNATIDELINQPQPHSLHAIASRYANISPKIYSKFVDRILSTNENSSIEKLKKQEQIGSFVSAPLVRHSKEGINRLMDAGIKLGAKNFANSLGFVSYKEENLNMMDPRHAKALAPYNNKFLNHPTAFSDSEIKSHMTNTGFVPAEHRFTPELLDHMFDTHEKNSTKLKSIGFLLDTPAATTEHFDRALSIGSTSAAAPRQQAQYLAIRKDPRITIDLFRKHFPGEVIQHQDATVQDIEDSKESNRSLYARVQSPKLIDSIWETETFNRKLNAPYLKLSPALASSKYYGHVIALTDDPNDSHSTRGANAIMSANPYADTNTKGEMKQLIAHQKEIANNIDTFNISPVTIHKAIGAAIAENDYKHARHLIAKTHTKYFMKRQHIDTIRANSPNDSKYFDNLNIAYDDTKPL